MEDVGRSGFQYWPLIVKYGGRHPRPLCAVTGPLTLSLANAVANFTHNVWLQFESTYKIQQLDYRMVGQCDSVFPLEVMLETA